MNLVFISPHFPPNTYLYCRRLRELGVRVLGIADAAYDGLRPELRDALTEYYRVDDLHDDDAMVRACGYFTHRYGKIDRIESLNEYWLETDARLRTEFNVPGIRAERVDRVKRKSAMKRVFERAGVRVARGRVVRTAPAARAFIDEVGYPVVAKPDVGVGAARTYRIANDTDLDAFLGDRPPIDYFLEEFLEGTLLSYDGLVDRAGEVAFDSSLVYGVTVLDSIRGQDMYYWIDREIAPDLREVGRRILDAFEVRERPFHFEFFRLVDGGLAALEVNMRQPGGPTVDLWNWANDIDFYKAWAEVVATGTTVVRTSRPYYALWAGRRTGRPYELSHEQVLERFRPMLLHHDGIDDVFSAAMGNYGYVVRGPSLEPLLEAARAILAKTA